MINFREPTPEDIDVRVQSIKPNGLVLLLYKDARADMNVLDETVGQEKWQCEYYEVNGVMFCRVGIKIGEEWVWKANAGSESNTEKEKRVCFRFFQAGLFLMGYFPLFILRSVYLDSRYGLQHQRGKML